MQVIGGRQCQRVQEAHGCIVNLHRVATCDTSIARERARKIASKNRSSTTTGIGGSFQLANSAPPLGVTGSASAPTARMPLKAPRRVWKTCLPRGQAGARRASDLSHASYLPSTRVADDLNSVWIDRFISSPEGVRALGESAMPGHARERR